MPGHRIHRLRCHGVTVRLIHDYELGEPVKRAVRAGRPGSAPSPGLPAGLPSMRTAIPAAGGPGNAHGDPCPPRSRTNPDSGCVAVCNACDTRRGTAPPAPGPQPARARRRPGPPRSTRPNTPSVVRVSPLAHPQAAHEPLVPLYQRHLRPCLADSGMYVSFAGCRAQPTQRTSCSVQPTTDTIAARPASRLPSRVAASIPDGTPHEQMTTYSGCTTQEDGLTLHGRICAIRGP